MTAAGLHPSGIVSLLPSATEIVCALGCGDRLKGRSHECDFPPEVQSLPVCTASRLNPEASSLEKERQVKSLLERGLSSIYEVDAALIERLRPDIILTQAQCEVCAVSLAGLEEAMPQSPGGRASTRALNASLADLEKAMPSSQDGRHPKIISLSPARLADVWQDIQTVADALAVGQRGHEILLGLKNRVVDIIQKTCLFKDNRRPTVACIEWIEPLMAAGNWVPELVDFAGGRNLFGKAGERSPWLDWKALAQGNPDIVVVMPCGLDLARARRELRALDQRPEWTALRAVKSNKVVIADGGHYFNRPGPRLVDSLEILAEILHPALFPFGHQGRGWERA